MTKDEKLADGEKYYDLGLKYAERGDDKKVLA